MPRFAYKAVNKENKEVFDIIEADSQALAISNIKELGLYPTQVRPARKADEKRARKKGRKSKGGGLNELYIGGASTKDVMLFTRQLATLIDAGLPLLRGLNVLITQAKPSKMRDIMEEVVQDIQTGATLAEALAKHPRQFDKLYINMIRAGEVGGILEVVLNRLATFMERRQALKRKVRSAMIYPVFVVVVAVVIVMGLLTYIVPQFAAILQDFGGKLPWMTVFLIDAGDFIRYKWWLLSLYVCGTLVTLKILFKIKYFHIGFDHVILKVPLIGSLIQKVAVARFSRTLGTLITSGVPILQSLRITKETIGNVVIEGAVQRVHDSIKEGDTIAAPLDQSKVFPPMVVNMIDVGEETGSLDQMLMKVADIYDDEVETAVEGLLRLMEPVLIVVLGGIIGFIVIALYLPIFSLADTISSGE
jgi:type IV pilus assembly protein PilC